MSASSDKPIMGAVCYTLSRNVGLPTWVWRVIFVTAVLLYGFGIFPYIVLWIFMPKAR